MKTQFLQLFVQWRFSYMSIPLHSSEFNPSTDPDATGPTEAAAPSGTGLDEASDTQSVVPPTKPHRASHNKRSGNGVNGATEFLTFGEMKFPRTEVQ
jgi:hypothetical protein